MAIRTTVVGSWWPYPEDEADLARYHAGKLSAAEGEAVLKRAATRAIAEQRSLGLTEWTGGEYHTDNFIMHMYARLTGIEIDKPQAEDPFDYDDNKLDPLPCEPAGLRQTDGQFTSAPRFRPVPSPRARTRSNRKLLAR